MIDNIEKLKKLCQLIRYDILTSTSAAGSGHPSSSLSAVELITTLFFGDFLNDGRIIFSKGHASPLLYSLYHAAGILSYDELLTLRKFNSNLEGHPTPRFPYVDVATGSLGQGLSIGIGMALAIRKKLDVRSLKLDNQISNLQPQYLTSNLTHPTSLPRVFVLLGDSEMAEGQVWEAIQIASFYKLNNLIGIIDVNRLGQRGETMLAWDLQTYQKRIESFGWRTIVIEDGHNLVEVSQAFNKACQSKSVKSVNTDSTDSTDSTDLSDRKPIMLIAKTIKGKGVSFLENKDSWHGKTLNKEQLQLALKELGEIDLNVRGTIQSPNFQFPISNFQSNHNDSISNENSKIENLKLKITHDLYSTREAYGDALIELGKTNPNIVALDAETSNSTYSDKFKSIFPDRFFEMFIAEQNMISVALGFSKVGYIPFVSSFAAFLTRSFDQIRMAQYSNANLKIVGSHCGVSIGVDGASQMALEDLAMFRSILKSVIFYPSDGVSTHELTQIMANNDGIFYLRTTREKTPIIYDNNEKFKIGGSKIHELKIDNEKLHVLIITAGITVHEALKAQKELANKEIKVTVLDCYSIKPIDQLTIQQLTNTIKNVIVVEDHYPYGGLGEAVSNILIENGELRIENFIHLCVKKIPRSGTPSELLHYEEIDSQAIITKVLEMI